MEVLEKAAQSAVSWLVVFILGGSTWVVRRIFTNEKKIALLQAHLENRDVQRNEDRERIKELRDEVKTLSTHVMLLVGENRK